MIKISYAIKLARTKLKVKRGILITSVVVASLLFSALLVMVMIFTGAEEGAREFVRQSGNNRYLVAVQPYIPPEKINVKTELSLTEIQALRSFEKQYYEELKAKYEVVGLKYDPKLEISALEKVAYADESVPDEGRFQVNWASPVISMYQKQKKLDYAKTATNKYDDLKKLGERYRATGYYRLNQPTALPTLPGLRLIQNGKEDFSVKEPKRELWAFGNYVKSIYNGDYSFADEQVLSRYLLKNKKGELKGIPVLVSAQEANELFGATVGLGVEPKEAGEAKKWLKEVQSKLIGQTYQVCYRNIKEQEMLQKIQRDFSDMENHKNDQNYQAPDLLYEYPTEVCGEIMVKKDTRSKAEKIQAREAEELQKKLGTYIAPQHRLLSFQIVGVRNVQPQEQQQKTIKGYIRNLLAPQDNLVNAEIPRQLYDGLPEVLKFDDIIESDKEDKALADEFAMRILEFTEIEDAKGILEETCDFLQFDCDKDFKAVPYGSNYLLIDEIGEMFSQVARVAFPIVAVLATIMVWLTISRMMLESRKEVAVYRAMGAKRVDIAVIYLVYLLFVIFFITILSLGLSIIVAFLINYFYGAMLTDVAVVAFSIIDEAPTINLFNLSSPLILLTIGLIIVVGLLASLQPLICNVKRNPIDDLRDE